MQNVNAKCPNCDNAIDNVHYEYHDPNILSGYRGSQSFTAVAYPCGHALGAVPVTWEVRLEELNKLTKEIGLKLDYLQKGVNEILKRLDDSSPKSR